MKLQLMLQNIPYINFIDIRRSYFRILKKLHLCWRTFSYHDLRLVTTQGSISLITLLMRTKIPAIWHCKVKQNYFRFIVTFFMRRENRTMTIGAFSKLVPSCKWNYIAVSEVKVMASILYNDWQRSVITLRWI